MSRTMRIKGPCAIKGVLAMPGDKSISHRVAMLACVADDVSTIRGFASSADCAATLDCIARLGVEVERDHRRLVIHGRGLRGHRPQSEPARLDAANSGSTIRMMSGLLAGQSFTSEIDGDKSLRRRPMGRIIEPLSLMGARIEARDGSYPPLIIRGGDLKAIDYASPISSAQVKTAVLFAGLLADGKTVFTEPAQSRNHTELMLQEFGASLTIEDAGSSKLLGLEGGKPLSAVDYQAPGDISSAAFFIAAAAMIADSQLVLRDVSLNETRTAFIDVLRSFGAEIAKQNVRQSHGETVGDLLVTGKPLECEEGRLVIAGDLIPNLIDEIPILAVAATQAAGRVEIRDAKELRVKESDRIRTVVDGIKAMGGQIEELEDGFIIDGPQSLAGGRIETRGDHRIAMAFSIAGLVARGVTEIVDADCAAVSFPEFYETLAIAAGEGIVE